MEATVNSPAMPQQKKQQQRRERNWGMIVRVGVVATLVLGLVGYAMKVTYESVIKGGVINRGDYYEVELKAMSSFEMDQVAGTVQDVPQRFRELDGKKVLLVGEVAPGGVSAADKIDRFTLCYSVAKCCFGGPPKAQHFVDCRTSNGRLVTNYDGLGTIKIFGTLHVNIVRSGGKIQSVYQVDLDRVEPVS
jgi:hypothetical protein